VVGGRRRWVGVRWLSVESGSPGEGGGGGERFGPGDTTPCDEKYKTGRISLPIVHVSWCRCLAMQFGSRAVG